MRQIINMVKMETVKHHPRGFPGGAVVKTPPANAEDPTCRGATKPVCHNY